MQRRELLLKNALSSVKPEWPLRRKDGSTTIHHIKRPAGSCVRVHVAKCGGFDIAQPDPHELVSWVNELLRLLSVRPSHLPLFPSAAAEQAPRQKGKGGKEGGALGGRESHSPTPRGCLDVR